MNVLLDALMLLTAFGVVQAVVGLAAVRAFAKRRQHPVKSLSPVTILKPVCGDEPRLEEAILSFCLQRYPAFQLIVGARDPDDPALEVARRLQSRFPECDLAVVAAPKLHGSNRKISNLMNMLPFAKHDTLVFADSDLHVERDYLVRVVAALEQDRTGLVTTLYRGEAAVGGLPALLGAMHISHCFLPGSLLAVALGRQDCLGCTMALRRDTLEQAGGLGALVDHLADDNVLGQRVRRLGLAVTLADTVPIVTVQERSFRALWLRELRWARTIRALTPVAFSLRAAVLAVLGAACDGAVRRGRLGHRLLRGRLGDPRGHRPRHRPRPLGGARAAARSDLRVAPPGPRCPVRDGDRDEPSERHGLLARPYDVCRPGLARTLLPDVTGHMQEDEAPPA